MIQSEEQFMTRLLVCPVQYTFWSTGQVLFCLARGLHKFIGHMVDMFNLPLIVAIVSMVILFLLQFYLFSQEGFSDIGIAGETLI